LHRSRENEALQTQQRRDEKTVAIATGLGLFCLILAVGGLALWGVDALLELSESTLVSLLWALDAVAVLELVLYSFRTGRR
jgi:hypothetical protein